MRVKTVRQHYLSFELPSSSSKVVQAYREKYGAINGVLLDAPEVLDLVHRDFERWLSASKGGRESKYTSEEILRVLVVMFVEAVDYREVVVRVENSEFLRDFVGLGFAKSMMDFSFVAKAFAAVSDETWAAMNETLGRYGREQEKVSGAKLRTDTTAVETNIHYPTDSSLLWDCFRVLSRVLQRVQRDHPKLKLRHRYHVKKVKKLAQFIARNAKSPSKKTQRRVKAAYATLLERVRWIVQISQSVRIRLGARSILEAPELEQVEPLAERVVDQTQRRVFEGEVVPSGEKVYSIFEAHTELIKRGKAGKPVEFGHKVLLCQTGEKFISHWRVLSGEEQDKDLVNEVLERHEAWFGTKPGMFAADKGFYESTAELARLERGIETVSICKKGRRTEAEAIRESSDAFQAGQRFRAGVEGSISVLKRAFKLRRCLFQGFKNFAAAVGCAVFCHNLVLVATT
jgi:IS5 family transposase